MHSYEKYAIFHISDILHTYKLQNDIIHVIILANLLIQCAVCHVVMSMLNTLKAISFSSR